VAKGKKTGGGSRKGIPNKVTGEARTLIAAFIDSRSRRAAQLWDKVADTDPARALEILGKLGEFVMPKLARTEHSGIGGGAIPVANANANISDDDAMRSYQRLVKGDAP
jgi:hypothetical protein